VRELNLGLIEASRDEANVIPPEPGALPSDVVAYFDLNEGEGDVARDRSGGDHDLELRGAVWVDDGIRGSALDFRGGGEHAVAAGPIVEAGASFSVAAWLRHRDRSQTATAISQSGETDAGFQVGLRTSDERPDLAGGYALFPPDPDQYPPWRWSFNVPDASGCLGRGDCGRRVNSSYGDIGLLPPEGQWEHVVAVRDADTQTISIYINGLPISIEQTDYDWSAAGTFVLGIGQLGNPGADSFDGSVDEVAVFDRALSSAEALQAFQAMEGPMVESGGGGGCNAGSGDRTPARLALMLGLFACVLLRRRRNGERPPSSTG
jgi:hypothetical protein